VTTYEEAREIVTAYKGDIWQLGTFIAAPWGYEDADFYLVPYGAREHLIGNDPAFMDMNGVVAFVSKETGELTEFGYWQVADIIAQMTPVGEPEPDFIELPVLPQ